MTKLGPAEIISVLIIIIMGEVCDFDFRTRLLSICCPKFTHSINLVQFHSSTRGINFLK